MCNACDSRNAWRAWSAKDTRTPRLPRLADEVTMWKGRAGSPEAEAQAGLRRVLAREGLKDTPEARMKRRSTSIHDAMPHAATCFILASPQAEPSRAHLPHSLHIVGKRQQLVKTSRAHLQHLRSIARLIVRLHVSGMGWLESSSMHLIAEQEAVQFHTGSGTRSRKDRSPAAPQQHRGCPTVAVHLLGPNTISKFRLETAESAAKL